MIFTTLKIPSTYFKSHKYTGIIKKMHKNNWLWKRATTSTTNNTYRIKMCRESGINFVEMNFDATYRMCVEMFKWQQNWYSEWSRGALALPPWHWAIMQQSDVMRWTCEPNANVNANANQHQRSTTEAEVMMRRFSFGRRILETVREESRARSITTLRCAIPLLRVELYST